MRVLLLILLLLFSACSQKNSKAKVSFSKLGFLANATNYHGGIKIWGVESGKSLAFSISMMGEGDLKQIDLPIGSWDFYAVGWDGNGAGSSNLYEGVVKCGRATKTLAAADESIYITLSSVSCGDYFSYPGYVDVNSEFLPLELISCNSAITAGPSNNCASALLGLARSYRVAMPDFLPSPLYTTSDTGRPYTFPFESRCIVDGDGDSRALSGVKIPQGTFAMSPLVVGIASYSSNDCSGVPLSKRTFYKNLMVPDPVATHASISVSATHTRVFLEDIFPSADLPTSLEFTSFPTNITTGYNFGFGIQLKKVDGSNYVGSSNYIVALSAHSSPVTCTGSISGTLGGTITQNTTSGVASYSGLNYTYSEPVYIKAIVTGPGSVNFGVCSPTSITFSSASSAHHLAWGTIPPISAVVGTAMPAFSVRVEDISNIQDNSATNIIDLFACSDPGCTACTAAPLNNASATAATGLATFSSRYFTSSGSYYLKAYATGLIHACSSQITVSASGGPDHIEFVDLPSNVNDYTAFTFKVATKDAGGGLWVTSSRNIQLSFYNTAGCIGGVPSGTFSGSTNLATSSGVATFTSSMFDMNSDLLTGGRGEFYIKAQNLTETAQTACRKVIVSSCPQNYVYVNANPLMGTFSDFCVAKYEMKDNATIATSTPSNTPWVNISISDAEAKCLAIGQHLISNQEWMTLARAVEYDPTNWQSGAIDTGALHHGHSHGTTPTMQSANEDDFYSCAYTTDTPLLFSLCGDAGAQRRTLNLPEGEVIWDFAGNADEWIDWDLHASGINMAYLNGATLNNSTFANAIATAPSLALNHFKFTPSKSSWNHTTQGVGMINTSAVYANAYAARGGNYQDGLLWGAGIYTLDFMTDSPTSTNSTTGFRCAYTPTYPINNASSHTPFAQDLSGATVDDGGSAIALAHDGRLVVATNVSNNLGYSSGVISFFNRVPSVSYSSGFNIGWNDSFNQVVNDLLVDDSGMVISVGRTDEAALLNDIAIWRHQPNGTPGWSVILNAANHNGLQGFGQINGGDQEAHAVILDWEKNVLAVGTAFNGVSDDLPTLWKVSSSGSVIGSAFLTNVAGVATDVAVLSDGNYLVSGYVATGMQLWFVDKTSLSATPLSDGASGYQAHTIIQIPGLDDFFALGTDGADLHIWKFLSNGTFAGTSLDNGFGASGRQVVNLAGVETGYAGVIKNGSLIIAGERVGSNAAFAVKIDASTGVVDASFGDADSSYDGYYIDPNAGSKASDIVQDGMGVLYMVGARPVSGLDTAIWKLK